MFKKFMLVVVLFLAFAAIPSEAARYYVTQGGAGVKNGSSWADASNDLWKVVDATYYGDEVWVAHGKYYVPTLELKAGVKLYGGFAGTETSIAQRDWTFNVTELNGDDSAPILTVESGATNDDTRIDGLVFSQGSVSGTRDYRGGGITNNSASPAIENCTFKNCYARYGGGAIRNVDSSPKIANCVFEYNTAYEQGGAVRNVSNSRPIIRNSVFIGNGYGGSYSNPSSTIYNDASGGIIENCSFVDGKSYNYYKYPHWSIWNEASAPVIINSTFSNKNSVASLQFGGIYNNNASDPVILNCTFSENSNAGILNIGNSKPKIVNSIFWDNSGGEILSDASSVPSVTYSVVKGGYAGEGNIATSPLLGARSKKGNYDYYPLTINSSAIGKGLAVGTEVSPTVFVPATDQLGTARSSGVDIGAIEYDGASPVTVFVQSVTISGTRVTIPPNSNKRLSAVVKPDNATNQTLLWTSSNNDVATVDQNGNVSAVSNSGSCIITASSTDGSDKSSDCEVTITSGGGDDVGGGGGCNTGFFLFGLLAVVPLFMKRK